MKKFSPIACAPAAAALAGAALLAPGVARAQLMERVYLHAEGAVGGFLGSPQSDRFGLGFEGSGRLGVRIVGPLAIHVMGGYWSWGAKLDGAQSGSLTVFGGGLRIAPELSRSLGRVFLDLEAGYSLTGSAGNERLFLGAGLGWAIPIAGPLEFGPIVRYGQVMASSSAGETTDQNGSGSANFWTAGLFLGLHGTRNEAPTETSTDADGDGVPDADDQCPTVPQGAHPDPTRRGCPASSEDTDGDGVPDAVDQCPTVPQGALPDPTRRGCPAGDRDNDGVADPEDLCPDTPAGAHPDATRRGCPDGDRDRDGVSDSADQCPDTPAGLHPDPQRPGCPAPDRDGDTVPDAVDHCPDQPGAPSMDPNQNGCPSIVRMDAGRISILEPVLFDNGRATIKPQSFRVLERVADVLRSTPQVRRVAVEGHTDDHGNADRNLALSQRRTESVVAYLVAHGVEASRLEGHGYGQTHPLVPNTSSANRAQNRRVEFLIVDPPALGAGATGVSPAMGNPGGPGVQILNVGVPEEAGGRHGHHGHHGHHGGGGDDTGAAGGDSGGGTHHGHHGHHGGGGGHHGHHGH